MYPFKILNKLKYGFYFFNAFLENICVYTMPFVLATFLTMPFDLEKFKWLILFTVLLKTLEIFFNIIWNTKGSPFLISSEKDLQLAYFKRICHMNIASINEIHTGYLKKQIDIVSVETGAFLEEMMTSLNGFLVACSIFLIQVWFQSPIMFLICLLLISIIVIYNILITNKNVWIQEKYNSTYAKYNATTVDFLQNIKIVKNFKAVQYAINKITEKFNDVKQYLQKSYIFYSLRVDGIHALVYLMYIIILINLFFRMKHGDDVFSYVVFYSSIFSGLNAELKGLGALFVHFNKFKSANNQIEKMISEEENTHFINNWQIITLKGITFQYGIEQKSNVHIPLFNLKKGDKVSFIGESGQGKTTFLNLFCRFYPIDKENYLVDGKMSEEAPDIAYISQETDLFDLSIRDNLCLEKDIKDEVLYDYLNVAGLSDWLEKLENGLDTVVGEKGIKLSAGQKQRLNIIRGILLDKEIYILDEPTSNLDTMSENKIYDMINTYLKSKTCLIVTHRPKLINICNKHYYFENHTLLEASEE